MKIKNKPYQYDTSGKNKFSGSEGFETYTKLPSEMNKHLESSMGKKLNAGSNNRQSMIDYKRLKEEQAFRQDNNPYRDLALQDRVRREFKLSSVTVSGEPDQDGNYETDIRFGNITIGG